MIEEAKRNRSRFFFSIGTGQPDKSGAYFRSWEQKFVGEARQTIEGAKK
jgi:hypothetical protein